MSDQDLTMIARALHAKVVDEAHSDAVAFFREFQHAIGHDPAEVGWVTQAWADIKHDFKLTAEVADQLWPAYWKAFCDELTRFASMPNGSKHTSESA